MAKNLLIGIIFFIIASFAVGLNLWAQQNPPRPGSEILLGTFPRDTSPQGLQVYGQVFGIYPLKVGTTIRVQFKLKNDSNRDIRFDSNGVFVGARWNSTTDRNNRDFGHQYRNFTLPAGRDIAFEASMIIDKPGTWRFWPAYHINGRYGPFRWHEVVVEVIN